MESNAELQQSRSDFKRLILEGALPPKMQTKLSYLQASIIGGEVDQRLAEGLPQFERISLSMMNMDTKVSLFNSIVRCLAGRELVVYLTAVKAGIKPQGSTSSSTKCYISFDSQAFRVHKDKNAKQILQIFPTEKLMVSKIYRKDKNKYSFAIAREDAKFRLKFDEEGSCAKVHGELLRVIRQKRSMKAALAQRQSQIQRQSDDQFDDEGVNTGQLMVEQQRQFLQSLLERVQKGSLSDTEGFQLYRNTQLGKVMTNKEREQVRLLMFLQNCSVAGLLQSYVQLASWNVQVQSFRIVNCIRRNNYLAHLKLKKQGLFGSQRQAWVVLSYFWDCKCLRKEKGIKQNKQNEGPERHYLLISSVNNPQQYVTSGVTMTFQQIVEFSQVQGRPGCIFLNLSSIIDFKVWSYLQSSLDLNIQFLTDIPAVALLSQEREMLKSRRQIFHFKDCACTQQPKPRLSLKIQRRKSTIGSQIGSLQKESNGSESQFQIQSGRKRVDNVGWSSKQVMQLIEQHNKFIRNQRVVQLIKQRVFERYYLKDRFYQHVDEQPYVDSGYRLRSRQNFLGLGSRWKLTSGDDFVFIDQEELKMQKGVLKLIVKQITSNLMAGKSIMSMSLPVEIFDDFSALEGFAKIFGFVPPFMSKAVQTVSIPEQIRYVAAAFIFIFACDPKVNKPFNPILGETLQASIGGIPIYFEQTSHHPPISTFYMKTSQFQAFGNIDIAVEMGLNSAHSRVPAPMFVRVYNTKSQYIIKFADLQVGGIMFGQRTMRLTGKGFILERRSGVYLEYCVGKQRKGIYQYKQKIRGADLTGGVFQITPKAVERVISLDRNKPVEGIRAEEVIRKYSLITGKWFGELSFDGVVYKSVKNGPLPLQLQRPSLLLPSDCTFRLDIVYRRWRNYSRSNQEKEVLQNLQRADRRLREKYFVPAH